GNAGYIDTAAFLPTTMPRDLPTLLARLRGDTPHVHVQFAMLPFLMGWFLRYWRESSPERILAAAYARILPLINYENRQCGLRATKAVMAEGGVRRGRRRRPAG
ncbi:MAG: hypothetical protein ACKOUS_08885, partial [Alphaproteobacteria bacterium]